MFDSWKTRTCVLAESQKEALVGADAVDEIDVKSVDVKFGRSNVESVGDELKQKLINRKQLQKGRGGG